MEGGEETDEGVETVTVGASLGESEDEAGKSGFTSEDYSDYNPEEGEKKEAGKKDETSEKPKSKDLVESSVEDEDKLYEE